MVESASYYNLKMRSLVLMSPNNCETAVKPVALAFNSSVDFYAVVANFKFLVQMPKLQMTAWALNFLLLLTTAGA